MIPLSRYLRWLRGVVKGLGGVIKTGVTLQGGTSGIVDVVERVIASVQQQASSPSTPLPGAASSASSSSTLSSPPPSPPPPRKVVVVNCLGLGAGTVFGDTAVYPCRGQVVGVRIPVSMGAVPSVPPVRPVPPVPWSVADVDSGAYVIPLSSGEVECGGTAVDGVRWERESLMTRDERERRRRRWLDVNE
jgi:hypothetical protein